MTIPRFGLGLITCQQHPTDHRSDAERYAEALEVAEDAERLGLDSVWVSEHHFVDDGYLPSLLPMCAAIAARTSSITVGTALLLAPLHDPLRLAEDAAVVDLISGGRLTLGVGLGWRPEEFDALRSPADKKVRRLLDAITILRQAWQDESVTGTPTAPYEQVPVRPKPAQAGGPPIWIGGLSEPALRRAGRVADGMMATEVDPAALGEQVAWALQERDTHRPGAPFTVSLHIPVFVADNAADARVALEAAWYVGWKYEDMDGARSRTTAPAPAPAPTDADLAAVAATSAIGTLDEVTERLAAYLAAGGDNVHFIARGLLPGLDPRLMRRSIERYATEVVPALRAAAR